MSNSICPPEVSVYLNCIGEVVVFEKANPDELLLIKNKPPVPNDLKLTAPAVVEFSKFNYPVLFVILKLALPPATLSIIDVFPD